jgi:hypothetical protein
VSEVFPWLCLAVAVLGLVAMVSAWFDSVTNDTAYLLYAAMVLGGFVGFLVLR